MINVNKKLFWDVDYKKLDYKKYANFIIGRALIYGDMDDWKAIKQRYGMRKIKNAAQNMRYLDKKSLNFWSLVLDIPKKSFRCTKTLLTKKQSPFLNR